MDIIPITKKIADEWVRTKHYSRRPSIFWAGFGLVEADKLTGVVVYGQPSPPIQRFAFVDRDFKLYELTRLVIQSGTPNAASFLIGQSLKLLPAPCAVISYADTEHGHAGIVYQATNWLYTGATVSHDHAYLIDGKRVHPMSLRDQGITNPKQWARERGVETVAPLPKHRYITFVGDKRQRRAMLSKLKYPVVQPYPKLPQSRYDDGPDITMEVHHGRHIAGQATEDHATH